MSESIEQLLGTRGEGVASHIDRRALVRSTVPCVCSTLVQWQSSVRTSASISLSLDMLTVSVNIEVSLWCGFTELRVVVILVMAGTCLLSLSCSLICPIK